MHPRIDRTGEIVTHNGIDIKILVYKNDKHIYVEFQDYTKYSKWTSYGNLKKGIDNPYYARTVGVGYMGNASSKLNGVKKDSYNTWRGMLERCYGEKYQKKFPAYIGCSVCDEWKSYEIFEKWYNLNYYEAEDECMQLDKDILVKGNKIYSPNTCIFVPQTINKLFTKTDKLRNGLIGTSVTKSGKYLAQCQTASKTNKSIKVFVTEIEAFNAYKQTKEKYIKQVAERYKNNIPSNLYLAMYKYQVDIND